MLPIGRHTACGKQEIHMSQTYPARNRLWQTITMLLTIIGILLFIYGSNKAVSSSDDKEYVEGKERQQLSGSSLLTTSHGGSGGLAGSFMRPVDIPTAPPEQHANTPISTPDESRKENKSGNKPVIHSSRIETPKKNSKRN